MSRTIAVHVRYNSWYISLLSPVKQEREMTEFCVVWRTWTTTANIFKFLFSDLSVCLRFSFVIALTKINKVNYFKVLRGKFIFNRRVLSSTAAMKTDLKLPILPCGLGLWSVCFSFDNVFLNSCILRYQKRKLTRQIINIDSAKPKGGAPDYDKLTWFEKGI